MSRPPLPEDGRVRRRIEAMRRVQDAALDLFEERGYSAVTVDEIAAAASVGPATVYRSFGTKERVVLWDEYDPMLLEAIAEHLANEPLLDAVTSALVASLDRIYQGDRRRILRRARLMLTEPTLVAAAALDAVGLRAALADLFTSTRAVPGDLEAAVAAAAVTATLEAAVRAWVDDKGRTPMADVLRRAFESLADLPSRRSPAAA
ncbi:MAG: helix-turn-helix domain-containing protein [Polyangiaceae bacterium]